MKISYQDKAQSNEAQERDFLQLSPVDRIYAFIRLSYQLRDFPTKAEKEKKDNFIIEIKTR